MLHGYVEVYGPKAPGITAEYEVATKPDAPALINLDAPPYPAGDERVIFSTKLQVNQLPPGKYGLRAIFSEQGKAVKTLTRPFEIAPPKVLMTSAEGLGAVSVDSELFLPVDEAALAAPFKRDDAVKPEVLDQFSEPRRAGIKRRSTRASRFWPAATIRKPRRASRRRSIRTATAPCRWLPGGGVRRGRPQHRGGQRVADRPHRRIRLRRRSTSGSATR